MPRCVIIAPTRELTTQLYEQAMKFANGTKVRVAKAYGEYDYGTNMKEIYRGCDIVVCINVRSFYSVFFRSLLLVA
jgi:superfamily II DNA/RNA helicase